MKLQRILERISSKIFILFLGGPTAFIVVMTAVLMTMKTLKGFIIIQEQRMLKVKKSFLTNQEPVSIGTRRDTSGSTSPTPTFEDYDQWNKKRSHT